MLVPERGDVEAVFAGDMAKSWPCDAYEVAAHIAIARGLMAAETLLMPWPFPVSIAMVQAILTDLAAEGTLTVRTTARWRAAGFRFVLDQRTEARAKTDRPVTNDDTLLYGRAQDEQAWIETERAETVRVFRLQAGHDALLLLRDRHPDEYHELVAQSLRALEQAPDDPGRQTKATGSIA